jgi:hypothetical protein
VTPITLLANPFHVRNVKAQVGGVGTFQKKFTNEKFTPKPRKVSDDEDGFAVAVDAKKVRKEEAISRKHKVYQNEEELAEDEAAEVKAEEVEAEKVEAEKVEAEKEVEEVKVEEKVVEAVVVEEVKKAEPAPVQKQQKEKKLSKA